ncbi:MAG: ribonuclease P protein subunit [Nanopusillaceae archaeon]
MKDLEKKTLKFQKIKNFIRGEFIGLKVQVLDSKISSLKGIYGTVVDETKNTIVVEDESGRRFIIPKALSKFLFYYNDYIIFINGKIINKRPWERLKIKIVKRI